MASWLVEPGAGDLTRSPAQRAHQHHGNAPRMFADVDAEQVGPRRIVAQNVSWIRNRIAQAVISAPRIDFRDGVAARLFRELFVTNAREMPDRKMNSGAGSVPPSCDQA